MKEFDAILSLVRAEAGCSEYVLAIDIENSPASVTTLGPNSFVVVEKWATREALEAHAASKHMIQLRARIEAFIQARSFFVVG